MLREAGSRGVCSVDWYANGLPNARNRVVELQDRGFVIGRAPCADAHGRTTYFRYVLTHDPEYAPIQQRLAV